MDTRAPRFVFPSIALIGSLVLVLQISLTRLLSAGVSYHSAFFILALVMLGLATSATAVFIDRASGPLPLAAAVRALVIAGLLAAGSVLAIVALSAVPLGPFFVSAMMLVVGATFFGVFYFTGYAVAFLLAEYAADTGRVYWADLWGASLGCLVVVPLLEGRSALVVLLICASGCALSAWLLASIDRGPWVGRAAGTFAILAGVTTLAIWNPALVELRSAKGQDQRGNLWTHWNHLARVSVSQNVPGSEAAIEKILQIDPDANAKQQVNRWLLGWGMSEHYQGTPPEMLWLQLDADAGTQILKDGARRVETLDFIEWDVTSAAHVMKRSNLGEVFVIGGGGGRDILGALHFGADRVRVAELNPTIVHAVQERFGDYSGGTYSLKNVELTVGEARSVLSREGRFYDLIQMSMIDTWASSMAGAMVLSENVLYTKEAFGLYFEGLDEDGALTVSRWFHSRNYGESGRVVALMADALRHGGIQDPADHIAILVAGGPYEMDVMTAIMKRSPLEREEIAILRGFAETRGFKILWPDPDPDQIQGEFDVAAIVSQNREYIANSSFDLLVPTDDRPFFFNTRRPFSSWVDAILEGDLSKGSPSTVMILSIAVVLFVVGRRLVILPLREHDPSRRLPLRPMAYFAGIGLGFMWVELAVIQRYIVFLGHPTYALSVVLFVLLLFGGLGSALSPRLTENSRWVAVVSILVLLLITAALVPSVTEAAHGWSRAPRIALSAALIAPLGLAMGTMYPSGVRKLDTDGLTQLVPWVWAINGLSGVFASVMGMLIAIAWGYTALLFLGIAAYGLTAWASTASWAKEPSAADHASAREPAAIR